MKMPSIAPSRVLLNVWLLVALLFSLASSEAQVPPRSVPDQYKRFFFFNEDRRSMWEKILNSLGLTSKDVGRSFALIAGVSYYPNLFSTDQKLLPAEIDIQNLKQYLRDQEFFDQIVVLKDGDMTLENLNYFLNNYFPEQLRNAPHSRFLFVYSGHGYADGKGNDVKGFLLKSSAKDLRDTINAVPMNVLRTLIEPNVDSAGQVLVLINACHSATFLQRRSFGPPPPTFDPSAKGAHAIMASRAGQESFHYPSVGPGSVFFEKIFAGLGGAADISPKDGVITYHELVNYLRSEIPLATHGSQIPVDADIGRAVSEGEFFLNRNHEIHLRNAPHWIPATIFGGDTDETFGHAVDAFEDHRYTDCVALFEQAANGGNVHAMYWLGTMYDLGRGVPQDFRKANEWYEKAAAAEYPDAMYALGTMYNSGHGVRQNDKEALAWYEKAALAGSVDAMTQVAYMYQHGRGVDRNFEESLHWYEEAAAAGSARAMNGLAYLYETGQGVKKDYEQAKSWYETSANAGEVSAMNNLASMYVFGKEKNYEAARRWYERAVDANNIEAMNGLGYMYDYGRGVPQDQTRARMLYERSAAGGCAAAMYNLGLMYQYGRGVVRDSNRARSWYQKAAEAGSAEAKNRL